MEDWEEKRRIISVRLNQEVRLNVFSFYRNDLIYRSRLEGFQVSGSHKHGKSSMCLGKKKRKKITAAINRKRIKVGREWGSSGVPNSFARSYELALLGEHWIRSQNRNSTERHASRHFRLRMSKKLNSFFFFLRHLRVAEPWKLLGFAFPRSETEFVSKPSGSAFDPILNWKHFLLAPHWEEFKSWNFVATASVIFTSSGVMKIHWGNEIVFQIEHCQINQG